MSAGFYPKLAWNGIRKNSRLYTPYILTCIGTVMMFYIIRALSISTFVASLRGGSSVIIVLQLGSFVIAIFSLILLFYTNSFLIRRRQKEFGLYNILGMGKRSIGGILFWETLITAAIALVGGLAGGIVLSKLAELGLANITKSAVTFTLTVSWRAILQAVVLYMIIFFLICLRSIFRVRASNPAQLLQSENTGEKPPKANWVFAVVGVILLAGAYYLAVSIQDPLSALLWFFVAVIMVIAGTYLLFVAGSVAFCRLLQKKKDYYYKPNHFVSVSSMVFRMKRNGAGLASICILATMVLVMISSTSCLYFGAEDSLRSRYPHDIGIDFDYKTAADLSEDTIAPARDALNEIIRDSGVETESVSDYRSASTTALLTDEGLCFDPEMLNNPEIDSYDSLCSVYFMPLDDYNRLMGEDKTLSNDEVLLYAVRTQYSPESLTLPGGESYQVKELLGDFIGSGDAAMNITASLFIVLPDFDADIAQIAAAFGDNGEHYLSLCWKYGFDCIGEDDAVSSLFSALQEKIRELSMDERVYSVSSESVAAQRADFYGTYGGLFFLGIILSILFVCAAVLIIYYKQVCEGYEDQSRFDIMQKVGMTKRDIRRSVNSQLLTVFFLPLVAAGVHLGFAFPFVRKLLLLFSLNNVPMLLGTTGVSFLVFAVMYMLVYRVTSNTYFSLVSNKIPE